MDFHYPALFSYSENMFFEWRHPCIRQHKYSHPMFSHIIHLYQCGVGVGVFFSFSFCVARISCKQRIEYGWKIAQQHFIASTDATIIHCLFRGTYTHWTYDQSFNVSKTCNSIQKRNGLFLFFCFGIISDDKLKIFNIESNLCQQTHAHSQRHINLHKTIPKNRNIKTAVERNKNTRLWWRER